LFYPTGGYDETPPRSSSRPSRKAVSSHAQSKEGGVAFDLRSIGRDVLSEASGGVDARVALRWAFPYADSETDCWS